MIGDVVRWWFALLLLFAIPSMVCGQAGMTPPALLDGVNEIASPGVPGPLVVTSRDAFVVAVGGYQEDLHAPVVVGAQWGRGRVVAFGHTGYLSAKEVTKGDTLALLRNAVRWGAGDDRREGRPIRVVVPGNEALGDVLADEGLDVRSDIVLDTVGRLRGVDCVIIGSHELDETSTAVLARYVRSGGALVTAGLGWGWLQLNPGKTILDHPGNRLLSRAGVLWADGTLRDTSEVGFVVDMPAPALHSMVALDGLLDGADEMDLAQAAASATLAIRVLPRSDRTYRTRLRERAEARDDLIPSQGDPIRQEDALRRFLLAFLLEDARITDPRRVQANPAALEFPGVPSPNAREEIRTVTIDCRTPGWHSTGLYAKPGQRVQFTVGDAGWDVGQRDRLRLRIGAHKDTLWHKPEWRRAPEITVEVEATERVNAVSGAFGGLVYVHVPHAREASVQVTIRGAVPSPRYVLDETTKEAWDVQRRLDAPWGELETRKVILTVPSDLLRDLDDPESLMRFWDSVLDSQADLATIPRDRERPERIVADIQISYGYMHAGYPIMTHLDAAGFVTRLDDLRIGKKTWGLFHELGHNHQSSDWTFDGTIEVTCNLFTLYSLHMICGIEPGDDEYGAARQAREVAKREAYFAEGAPFETWKKEPMLALSMYRELQDAFGWDAFKAVFAEYRDLPDDQRPKSDDEKRDQWIVRFGKMVERDLGPFFERWGVPVSAEARGELAAFPVWVPDGWE